MLTIDPDVVLYISIKARELDHEVATEHADAPPEATEPPEDEDSTYEELTGAIQSLNDDEAIDLVALAWLGSGDITREEWREARIQARELHETPQAAALDLVTMPLLSDCLEEGLSQLGYATDRGPGGS